MPKRLRYFLLFILLLSSSSAAFAQKSKIDSMQTVWRRAPEDTDKVNTLNQLTRLFYLSGQYDTAMVYANLTKSLSEKAGFRRGVAAAYNNIGNIYYLTGNLDSSLKNHMTSLAIQTEINNPAGIASSHNNLGNIHFTQGNYPAALEDYLASKAIYETHQGPPEAKKSLASTYNNIGNVYFSEENYDDAATNYSQALKIRLVIDDKHGAAASYGNLGNVYYMQHKYQQALENHLASLRIKKEINDVSGTAATYGNIGAVHYDMKQYNDAMQSFVASMELSKQVGDQYALANAFSNIGQTLVMKHEPEKALVYFDSSLVIGRGLNSKDVMKNCYNGLMLADSALGRWQEAFSNFRLFVQYRDSLLNEENSKKIVQTQMQYEMEKQKVKEEEKLEHQKLINLAVASSLILLLLLSLLLFNRFRLKRENRYQQMLNEQQKKQAVAVMETQEQERKRIAEDLHDSLGHLLSTVKLNLQTFPDGQKHLTENPLQLLNQASGEIRNITFNLMPRTLEDAGLVAALHEMAANLADSGRIRMNVQVFGNFTGLEQQAEFNIYRIVQEAVNNIIKHAQATEIQLQLLEQEGQLVIMIEDDGKGFERNTVQNGRGIRNIETRATWLNGTTRIDSTPGRGTTIVVEIPLQAA